MAILAYDDVMLREPRLLVPGLQPLGLVKVDWSNPLARGMTLCHVSSGRHDVTNGQVATNVGSGTFASYGNAIAYRGVAGTGNGLSFGAGRLKQVIPAACNTYSIFHLGAPAASGTRYRLFANGTDAGPPYAQHSFIANGNGAGSGSGYLELIEYDGGTVIICDSISNTLVNGTLKAFFAVRTAANAAKLYINGIETASAVNGSYGTANVTAGLTMIGGIAGASSANTSPHLMTAVWSRALSPAEVLSVSLDPYQFLIPA